MLLNASVRHGLPRSDLGNQFELFQNTWGAFTCNRWIMSYLSVHHKKCMAMVKCILTRDIYLPANRFPKGKYLVSAAFLKSHFYIPAVARATCTFFVHYGSLSCIPLCFIYVWSSKRNAALNEVWGGQVD